MRLRWIVVLLAATACGEVVSHTELTEPEVSISPAMPAPMTGLTCVITTPSSGGVGPITYSASWSRNGVPYPSTPGTTAFTNDTIPAGDVALDDNYQCTVTASDGMTTVTATSATVTARCATGGMADFAANGAPPSGTVQQFVVPAGVCRITIEAGGGQGGDAGGAGATNGAKIIGTFVVMPEQTLMILVGQMAGTTGSNRLAGGGGTFVIGPGNTPMVIAGGGGSNFAGNIPLAESVGRAVTSGGTVAGIARAINGAGGNVVAGGPSGGGGGLMANGAGGAGGGAGYNQGGIGGGTECKGGFGGGGGRLALFGEGGGGGYSGGSCGDTTSTWVGCGGGGSLNTGTNPSNTAGAVAGNGYVKITW